METSLRYGGDSKALKIHAKQKIRIDTNTFFQVITFFQSFLCIIHSRYSTICVCYPNKVRGELDTKNGQPNSLRALVRHFYPDVCI